MTADEKKDREPSAALRLSWLAQDKYRVGRSTEDEPFAVPTTGPAIPKMLRGSGGSLRAALAADYRAKYKCPPSQSALADVMQVLEGDAQAVAPERLELRVAEADGATWLDLGDETGRAVRISPGGWEVVDRHPVLFRRTALTGALPEPAHGGSLDELWHLLNVTAEDRSLVAAVLVAMLWPSIAHPVTLLLGEQGSGKSSATRVLTGILDPSPVPLRKSPKDVEAWTTAAAGSWVVGVDNLSGLPDWLSDALCRAATGDGDVRRSLYSNGDLYVIAFRRCVVLNGIDVGAVRDDLADRLLTVNLERIGSRARRYDADLTREWSERHPRILGAVLDLAVDVMHALPQINLEDIPRMADFARILAAVDRVLGTDGLARYGNLADALAEDAVTGDPVLAALSKHVVTAWEGTSAELLELLNAGDDDHHRGKDWPTKPRALTTVLKRRAPSLRRVGWSVEDLGVQGHAKALRWSLVPPTEDTGGAGEGAGKAAAKCGDMRVNGDSPHVAAPVTRTGAPMSTCGDAEIAGFAGVAGEVSLQSLPIGRKEGREGGASREGAEMSPATPLHPQRPCKHCGDVLPPMRASYTDVCLDCRYVGATS